MKFLLQRLAFYLVTAWAAITINFLIPRLMPGDPVQSLIARFQGQLDTNAINSLKALFGLDKKQSLWQQYTDYWAHLFHGDLGLSFTFFPTPGQRGHRPVAALDARARRHHHADQLPARHRHRRLHGLAARLLDGQPAARHHVHLVHPVLLARLIAISLFAVKWPLFPADGGYDNSLVPAFDWPFISSALYHGGVLPGFTIVLSAVAGWILGMRNMMVTVSSEDYVMVAQAKGLSERRVMFGYAARNAILPNISGFALSLGFIVGGTLLVEMVFSYPGIGYQLFQGVGAKDYPPSCRASSSSSRSPSWRRTSSPTSSTCSSTPPYEGRRRAMAVTATEVAVLDAVETPPAASKRKFRFLRGRKTVIGLGILLFFVLMAIIGRGSPPRTTPAP